MDRAIQRTEPFQVFGQDLHKMIDLAVFADLVIADLSIFGEDPQLSEKRPGLLVVYQIIAVQKGGKIFLP